MYKLAEGRGNLVIRSEELKKRGAKASKQIDTRLVNRANDQQYDLPAPPETKENGKVPQKILFGG